MDLKPIVQNKWLLLLGAIGVACLLFGTLWSGTLSRNTLATGNAGGSGSPPQNSTAATQSLAADPAQVQENTYDQQLAQMIEKMQGINDVSVMVTLTSTANLEVANNVQHTTQQQTGNSSTTSQSNTVDQSVFTQRNSDGSSVPFVVSQQTPKVRGVFVVVNAYDFDIAKSEIIDAIQHVLDVPAYKISVEPEKSKS